MRRLLWRWCDEAGGCCGGVCESDCSHTTCCRCTTLHSRAVAALHYTHVLSLHYTTLTCCRCTTLHSRVLAALHYTHVALVVWEERALLVEEYGERRGQWYPFVVRVVSVMRCLYDHPSHLPVLVACRQNLFLLRLIRKLSLVSPRVKV
jgi:hypothetical protein